MTRKKLAVLLGLAAFVAAEAPAEVSVTRHPDGSISTFFAASPTGPWGRVRADVAASDLLNPQGDARGDGWPVIVSGPGGLPSVVHETEGIESEILLWHHDGQSWRFPLNVSRRFGPDYGPSMVIDPAGNRFVAWTHVTFGRASIYFAGVSADGSLQGSSTEISVRTRQSREPSIGVAPDGDVYVAYEEADSAGGPPFVAIDRIMPVRNPDMTLNCSGENTADLSRSTSIRTALGSRLIVADATVNSELGTLWVTWIDAPNRVGWVELLAPGVFTAPAYETFDPAVGPQSALDAARTEALR